jgi:hypothetical protein
LIAQKPDLFVLEQLPATFPLAIMHNILTPQFLCRLLTSSRPTFLAIFCGADAAFKN